MREEVSSPAGRRKRKEANCKVKQLLLINPEVIAFVL